VKGAVRSVNHSGADGADVQRVEAMIACGQRIDQRQQRRRRRADPAGQVEVSSSTASQAKISACR
jgi:hypothetical protein